MFKIFPAICALFLCFSVVLAETNRPNFLIIIGDDCTYNDLPIYGGQNAKTPYIDELAAGGLIFDHAYLCSAMCQPCRSELYTGLYPMRNGCAWNHSACKEGTRSLPHYLEPLGYRVGLAGKKHVRPESVFPFEIVEGFDPSCVRNPTHDHDLDPARTFIEKDSPFCLTIALVEPHVPWVMGDASQYPPKEIILPENLANTKITREHFSNYLAEITYMDSQVGQILDVLEKSGKAENTLVIFTSEQGSQFPGCKWTNWNTGVHTGMVASWPGKIEAGKRTGALVQYADIVPTLMDLAGGEEDREVFDGHSFADVLMGKTDRHRDFVYHMHNNVPEGPPYPIRAISDGEYRYIKNLRPDELYIEKHLMGGGRLNNPYFATWLGADPVKKEVYHRLKRYMLRPAEQLYHTREDPYEMHNLAGSESVAARQTKLKNALEKWLKDQGDPGSAMDDLETLGAARKLLHKY